MKKPKNKQPTQPTDINQKLSEIFGVSVEDISPEDLHDAYKFADTLGEFCEYGRREMRPIDIEIFLMAFGFVEGDWSHKQRKSICNNLRNLSKSDYFKTKFFKR